MFFFSLFLFNKEKKDMILTIFTFLTFWLLMLYLFNANLLKNNKKTQKPQLLDKGIFKECK